MIVNTIPTIETIRANPTNGNIPSTLGDATADGIGPKFIKEPYTSRLLKKPILTITLTFEYFS